MRILAPECNGMATFMMIVIPLWQTLTRVTRRQEGLRRRQEGLRVRLIMLTGRGLLLGLRVWQLTLTLTGRGRRGLRELDLVPQACSQRQ